MKSKISLLWLLILLCCKAENKSERILPEPTLEKPPVSTGVFVVKVYDAADVFAEPSLKSRVVLRIPIENEVETFSDLRIVIDPRHMQPTRLLLVKYGKISGWLNPEYLGFRDSTAARPHVFRGRLNSFRSGCLTAKSTADIYGACGNCGTLDFFPWGGFAGTLGCDEHLSGSWYVERNMIHVVAEGETMCNHFMGTDPETDKDYMKKCLDFQAKTHRSYHFKAMNRGEKWVTEPEIKLGSQDTDLELYAY